MLHITKTICKIEKKSALGCIIGRRVSKLDIGEKVNVQHVPLSAATWYYKNVAGALGICLSELVGI